MNIAIHKKNLEAGISIMIHLEITIYPLQSKAHIKQGLYTRELGKNTWFRRITNIEYFKV